MGRAICSKAWRLTPLFLMVGLLMAAAPGAYADQFDFSLSGTGISASGVFTTDSESAGSFLITGITGTFNGLGMTLLAPNAFFGNDNLLFPNQPQLDFNGISFAAGTTDYNVYFAPAGQCTSLPSPCPGYFSLDGTSIVPLTFSASAVPEPSSLILLGCGLAAMVGARRRKMFRPSLS